MRIDEALRLYTVQLRADGRSEHTIKQYGRHVRLLASWLASRGHSGEVEELDHEVLALFLVSQEARTRPDGREKKATAMNALRSTLRTFFAYVHAAGWASSNPARLVRRARCAPPPPRALTEREQELLLAALAEGEGFEAERDRALFGLMLHGGLRLGSALGLDAEDVDLAEGVLWLHSTKGDRPARLLLGSAAREALEPVLELHPTGPLFTNRTGRRLTGRQVHRRFAGLLERAGIQRAASPHSLRHSFAAGLYARTGDIRLVQRALTHRSVLSTAVYATCGDERLRAALEMRESLRG